MDKIITAEIADGLDENSVKLKKIQLSHLIHSCDKPSATCIQGGKCKYGFPQVFQETSHYNENSYPTYRRRDTGSYLTKRNEEVTNQNVLPTNPFLSLMLNCHIYVEICSSFKSIKYIHKYIHKGPDMAQIKLKQVTPPSDNENKEDEQKNEIKQFISAR